jgi:hypothetical protein
MSYSLAKFTLVALLVLVVIIDDVSLREFLLIKISSPNQAISENGLLPYQLCGSNESNKGAGIAFSSFIHDDVKYEIAVTASSSWGEGANLSRIEFLAFFKYKDKDCTNHCEIHPNNPIISPTVSCRDVKSGHLRPGFFSIPAEQSLRKYYGNFFHVINILCPTLELDLPSSGETLVELYIGDEGALTFSLQLCYIHVTSVRSASLCTEPLIGISSNDSRNLAFWRGITNIWPNGYHDHTLLDAFLAYHMNILGLHVTINTYFPDEFKPHIQKYFGPNFAYRPGWNLPRLGPASNKHYNYEIFADATCQWEHRLDSNWVVAISAPDNFIFPRNYGESLDDALRRLDPEIYSGVEIPTMLSHSRNKASDENENVLQRWRVLDFKDEPYFHDRSIPLFNPRHSTHTIVHWNRARTNEFKENLEGLAVIEELSLSVVHIMALVRPEMNYPDAPERGDLQPWFDELGKKLESELEGLHVKDIK